MKLKSFCHLPARFQCRYMSDSPCFRQFFSVRFGDCWWWSRFESFDWHLFTAMSDAVYSPTRTYGRDFLLALHSSVWAAEPPRFDVANRLREVRLWTKRLCLCRTRTRGAWLRPYRGSRAGRQHCAKRPVLQARGNRAFVPVSVSLPWRSRTTCNSSATFRHELIPGRPLCQHPISVNTRCILYPAQHSDFRPKWVSE